jgi:predicted DCC family thiol-disulfide oxidoreductase YuxK
MKSDIRVAAPPPKPLLIYDGDCHFCKLWIARWKKLTRDAVDYLPSQDPQIEKQFPEIPREHFNESVQFIERDGKVFYGAEAAFRSLAQNPKWQWPLRLYKNSRLFSWFTERAYYFVARNRKTFSRLSGLRA